MKYLIVILVVLAVIWLVRTADRRPEGAGPQEAKRRGPRGAPQDMVECPVCHVHLPRGEALPGPDGQLYCCAEHRLRAGG